MVASELGERAGGLAGQLVDRAGDLGEVAGPDPPEGPDQMLDEPVRHARRDEALSGRFLGDIDVHDRRAGGARGVTSMKESGSTGAIDKGTSVTRGVVIMPNLARHPRGRYA